MASAKVPRDDVLEPDTGRRSGCGLRADAERNRDRILAAARRLYAAEGLDVPMAAIAREAGVGKATLSRRFATREDLITAVFADRMDAYLTAVTEALADPDPWHGFVRYVYAVCAMQAADRGFAEVLTMTFPTAKALESRRDRAYRGFLELIARAKATGHLREDFTDRDLPILLMANAGVIAATADAAPDAWRRLVGHMLRSYATPGAPLPPLPDAPDPQALYRAMIRIARSSPCNAPDRS
ncbi:MULTISPECIES: TetR/AcrR family transcriptional regulator [Thermomonospora]|uniref:Transcriptional regulator, TetR family n=1 Tax=Thermomonospora curvata (strain ATCC 19995 / DSM 43183 / JCM 3096 / KCTC 9072 / NBRC 15933 / NCIMB 10081 / Henssen B9) TaxID=471852 RepID=D1AAS6_THECD|nr:MULTISPECIES: TetR/AcrR family transcriptional regulator [Thermomonospora]ACY97086.1 transcriptional regulator, TetR family [Thermomonospora curvata DSM 43183]PKK14958.1 MAG: TetR/AcrR family transcriptional regulator [Thermomonospora sp. CIF 1]